MTCARCSRPSDDPLCPPCFRAFRNENLALNGGALILPPPDRRNAVEHAFVAMINRASPGHPYDTTTKTSAP